jgi:hypothetical protein
MSTAVRGAKFTRADERGPAVAAVEGLAVDIPRLVNALHRHRPGPPKAFGPCGIGIRLYDSSAVCTGSVIVSQADHDGDEWIHASIARERHMPTYDDLVALKRGVFGPDRYAYQVFPPADQHVSIHDRALHLWGRADGKPATPEFGAMGTI